MRPSSVTQRSVPSPAGSLPGSAFAVVVGVATAFGAIASGAGCTPAPAATPEHGRYLYENYCSQCHQPDAGGRESIAAPSIAGLPEWYVEGELRNFREGIRGSHFDDPEGLRMRPMSLTLAGDLDVKAVSMYVGSLAPAPPAPSHDLHGDATRGAQLYVLCATCHGPDGRGDPKQAAPPLTVQPDWYLVKQIHKFKAGVRGTNAVKDEPGTRMRPMAMTLVDDQAVKDVIAHVTTLRGAGSAPAGH